MIVAYTLIKMMRLRDWLTKVIIVKNCAPTIKKVKHEITCQQLGMPENPLSDFAFDCYSYHYLGGIFTDTFLDYTNVILALLSSK